MPTAQLRLEYVAPNDLKARDETGCEPLLGGETPFGQVKAARLAVAERTETARG